MKCTQCGGDVIGTKCLRPKCIEYWKNFWENKVQEKITDYQSQVELLKSYETSALKLEDYQELKKIEKETKKWEKELEDGLTFLEVKQFQQKITDLENAFPEKIRLRYKNNNRHCLHKSIHWEGCFKKENEKERPYCLDCGEDENKDFARAFQRLYCKEINDWLANKGLNSVAFSIFLFR